MVRNRAHSVPTLAVLRAFVERPGEPLYGMQLMKLAGVKSGSLYPILDRLEGMSWIVGTWEDIDPREAGRPRRRTYQLTDVGVVAATAALNEAVRRVSPWNPTRPGVATWA
jgi:PadR family transcriptional regulator PadR